MKDTYPNSGCLLVRELSTYLQESDLPSQSDHFVVQHPCSNPPNGLLITFIRGITIHQVLWIIKL
jgi:hypothetical protein